TIKHFTHLNVCGNMALNSNEIKATILFGAFRRRRKISPHQKAVEFALLNRKSLITKRLTNNSYIPIEDLRAIMIGAAARYSALSIKIPNSSASHGHGPEI
ncbi:Uncharacterized protein FKW44_007223, partial [Caligus rogercresseyi]